MPEVSKIWMWLIRNLNKTAVALKQKFDSSLPKKKTLELKTTVGYVLFEKHNTQKITNTY